EDAEAQWVSVDGTVVEAGLWFGPLAPEGPGRSALVLHGDTARTLAGDGARGGVGPLAGYLYEPDGAVIRAGLVGTLATRLEGHLLDPTIAYVTCEAPSSAGEGLAAGYRVLDSMPFNVKRLRAYLRERGVGRITVKKRGTAVTPEQLRSQLALRGEGSATLVLTRIAGAQRVLVVEALCAHCRSPRRPARPPASSGSSPSSTPPRVTRPRSPTRSCRRSRGHTGAITPTSTPSCCSTRSRSSPNRAAPWPRRRATSSARSRRSAR